MEHGKKRVAWSEMSYVWHLDILLIERMVRNFSTNHGVKKGETHITFDLTVELIRRDSIHNLLPHCNVISLRYSDETYFPEYNVKMSSGLVASGPTAFSAMQNTA